MKLLASVSAGLMFLSLVFLGDCGGNNTTAVEPSALDMQPEVSVRENALSPLILVADYSGHNILGYPLDSSGDQAPSFRIGGKRTGLGTPDNIALDRDDNIYTSVNGKTVSVFAAKSHGDARPIRHIAGKRTQLKFPIGVAVDSNGYLYVADCGYGDVKVFAPGAHGNVAPIRVISLSSGCTISEAVDSKDNLWVTSGDNLISEFSPESQGNNFLKEIQEPESKGGDSIRSIAIDSRANIYAGNLLSRNILVFSSSASGPAKPIRTIAGSKTHLGAPSGLSLDSEDNLYVTVCHYCSNGSGTDSVLVFGAGANGNIKPRAVITGKKTKLDVPTYLALRK